MDEERRRGTEGDTGVVTLRLWYSEDLLRKERMWCCVWGISLSSSMATVISSLSSPSLIREMKSVSPGLTQAAVMATAATRRPHFTYIAERARARMAAGCHGNGSHCYGQERASAFTEKNHKIDKNILNAFYSR